MSLYYVGHFVSITYIYQILFGRQQAITKIWPQTDRWNDLFTMYLIMHRLNP